MHISLIEIQGFRKLHSVRVELNGTMTLFVGANNSGKTSAMEALSRFLIQPKHFSTNDFTLSNWIEIDRIGSRWSEEAFNNSPLELYVSSWETLAPTLDVWLEVGENEIHYVRPLLPTLDWNGGAIGVRLRFEPTNIEELRNAYVEAEFAATQTKQAAEALSANAKPYHLSLWPTCMRSFLDRRLHTHFAIQAYLLDPAKREPPLNGTAQPQRLPLGSEPLEGNPLSRLIRIDEIGAQRGLGERGIYGDADEEQASPAKKGNGRLSEQLKAYFTRHLDPSESPTPTDLDALEAIETAQKAYDHRLTDGFANALAELQDLNYPGVTDPVIRLATRLRFVDGLSHSAAVQYELVSPNGEVRTSSLTLPEEYNGLGYQNLISMIFRLMSFRDAWMRVGKASRSTATDGTAHFTPPLHLVLVEEPEAHLHVQVQQVFVRKAYEVLRKHPNLGTTAGLRTQLIVSTHSSHIAHECDFAWLRYFRRLPAASKTEVPTSTVMNLSEVFQTQNESARFAARYLLSTHCDLFFADAAIFVEGAAERMLVPHFIKHKYPSLHRSYITLLQIAGSHAFRLRELVERLGLTTLIVSDLDSIDPSKNRTKAAPRRGANYVSANPTLTTWHPAKQSVDELLDLGADEKIKRYPDIPLFSVRVAYQMPVRIALHGKSGEALARTFEDALALENLSLFATITESPAAKKFSDAIAKASDIEALEQGLFGAVDKCDKAAFALDLLWLSDPTQLVVPAYISEGLSWLAQQLGRKNSTVLATAKPLEVSNAAPIATRI